MITNAKNGITMERTTENELIERANSRAHAHASGYIDKHELQIHKIFYAFR